MTSFKEGKFDEVYVIYNPYQCSYSRSNYRTASYQSQCRKTTEPQVETDYIFEPNRAEILDI
jgi:F-type H+-transporting ATPase subunit gamma